MKGYVKSSREASGNYTEAGTGSVVESLFSKVTGKISAFCNSAEALSRTRWHFLKISSSRNFTKFPFNRSYKLTVYRFQGY